MVKRILIAAEIAGGLLVSVGAGMVALPAGLVVAGVLIIVAVEASS